MDKDKERSAVADFLGEFGNKGVPKDLFNDAPKDPFAQEEVVETPVEEVKEEKPLPFNKDPKVQKFIEKEISKRMAEFKPTESTKEQRQENDEVVDALEAVIGNDTPEKRRAVQALRDRLDEGTRKITEWEQQQHQAEVADKEAEEELSNAFDNIEETFDVDITSNNPIARKTRQEFVSFVEKIAPKDRNGDIVDYPDMNSAWEMFDERRKATTPPSRAKELASRSMARSAETGTAQAIPVNKHSFERTDNFIESLQK